MRVPIVVLFALNGVLALAIVGLYARTDAPTTGSVASSSDPQRQDDHAAATVALPTNAELDRLCERLDDLSARIDRLSDEMDELHAERGRLPAPRSESVDSPSEAVFRAQHEKTILAILEEDRERLEVEKRLVSLREHIEAYWTRKKLPSESLIDVVAVFTACDTRASGILKRLAPDGIWPAPDDSRRAEWVREWDELREWRKTELCRYLEPLRADELLDHLKTVGVLGF